MKQTKSRILIFSLAYFPKFVGGAEVAVKEITDRLDDSFEFDMVTLRFSSELPKKEKIGSVTVYRVGPVGKEITPSNLNWKAKLSKIIAPMIFYHKACKLHKRNRYNLIWSIMANQAGIASMLFKKKNPNVPFLLTLQEGDSPEVIKKKARFVYSYFKDIFQKADYIQTISRFLADFARRMNYNGSIQVVPNGVDLNKFSNVALDEVNELHSKLKLNKDDFVVLTASRLVPKNGIKDLILSMEYLSDDIKLLILGDGPLQGELKELVIKKNLDSRIVFQGFVEHNELPKYFYFADVFVRPSVSEGLGNVFLEAMAAKLPVIATHVGGIPDIVTNEVTGLFAGINDSKDISFKINMILKDKELQDYLIRNGFQMVLEEYSWNSIVSQMKEVFRRTLESC